MAQDNFFCDLFRLGHMHLFKTFCPLEKKTHVRLNKVVLDQIFNKNYSPLAIWTSIAFDYNYINVSKS